MKNLKAFFVCLLLTMPCTAATIIVNYDGTGDYLTIQEAIVAADNGDTVLVRPGVYEEEVNFLGKAITVQGMDGAAVIDGGGDFAVSFYVGEGRDSVLKNFIIRNSYIGIFLAGSSPKISNVTVVDNRYGIEAYVGAEPNVISSIFWNNIENDMFQCSARYSCIEDGGEGDGNISVDPLFADANSGDYHLLSERGRYSPVPSLWVIDEVSSPCIALGHPLADFSRERVPNGGRINMGAYGGTPLASMSEWEIKGDMNHDGTVNMIDFSIFAEYWLQKSLRARQIDDRLKCAANLRELGRVIRIYANDHDGDYPPADQWCDILMGYGVSEGQFICPSAGDGPSHYAINPNCNSAVSPPDMVLLFESGAGWNQFGGPELLAPENHGGEGCNVLFNDMHVEFVEPGRFDELRWE